MNVKKGLEHLSNVDKKMARVIYEFEEPTFRKETNYFEALVRAIVYQQLSGKAASTIYNRFKELFNGEEFPPPKKVMEKSHEELRSVGFSNQKAMYVHNIAEAFENGSVSKNLDQLDDEAIIENLTSIKGVGPWTAEMFLMFTLHRPDVFPVTDLGVRKGFQLFCGLDELPDPDSMIKTAEPWRPFRTLASWYLWRLVEGPFEW
ncbi:MAG: DNA-3-methyladenine glycosylase [Candidatus Marinimicrobia bacterium]|mgnify:CR=1 FL=1|jgi:3-methyladenine DNA glycosylase/8-oxoguanine DNA glycosylase|nr:DNA-3-methyladenine glycosylase [Candidatus Neomarinimicrobiota bacterium]MDP7330749.1 DNA-3-methyladenine glycosylase [Candidatus Neomarinimicrobiota bacterium]HJL75300.1 DNA-3-methyladenine glycosylase [Candidatus Neomarinimicrobiota bacterium]